MKKHSYLLLILTIITSCITKTTSVSNETNDTIQEIEPVYEVYELTAVSKEGIPVYFNIIYGVSFNSDKVSDLDKEEISELKHYAKTLISSHTRSIVGQYEKEKLLELKKINSNLQEVITNSLGELNKSVEEQGIKIIKLDATMRNE